FEDEHGAYPAGTWIRSPHGSHHAPWSTQGCTLYVATGHLPAP
ncbi:MAG TPA: cupin domain-containing protein, partial [Burkholderiaceae bacterium]|nr:cupin domain-containing protein [Burkholderiaceae bacterium]